MSNLIKDKIRIQKNQVKSMTLKKENLKDKAKMQKDFIDKLESDGKTSIQSSNEKIKTLMVEVDNYMEENTNLENDILKNTKEQEEVTGAGDKLVKLNNLKENCPKSRHNYQRT
ncbi:MAG: hypothetical protein CM15mV26_0440 [uncultured marine virus]|nr:MAG: hypothetical protein CM15mV26_0440 [uncultured marine virus]